MALLMVNINIIIDNMTVLQVNTHEWENENSSLVYNNDVYYYTIIDIEEETLNKRMSVKKFTSEAQLTNL